jgi:hypothetical protein
MHTYHCRLAGGGPCGIRVESGGNRIMLGVVPGAIIPTLLRGARVITARTVAIDLILIEDKASSGGEKVVLDRPWLKLPTTG